MLRRASRHDLDGLMVLEATCFGDRRFSRDTVTWILADPSATTIVEDLGGIVGSIMVLFERDECRVLSVAVRPENRRRGIGRALMASAERLARGRRAAAIRLEVGTRNIGAIEFYRTLGYKSEGVLPAYYADGEDAYAMRKTLGEVGEANA